MEAMIAYTEGNTQCRSTTLLAYFDEPEGAPCGQCDVCRKGLSHTSGSTTADGMAGEPALPYQVDIAKSRWERDRGGKDSV
jgi:superfamily II DNA helicase RecQ